MHRIEDWLGLHKLDAMLVQDVLVAFRAGAISPEPFLGSVASDETDATVRLPAKDVCFRDIISRALACGLEDKADVTDALRGIKFAEFPTDGPRIPHTIDPGRGGTPVIVMDWQGRVGDLLCLAHECAHALQIRLSGHCTTPPIVRETCAFLGELLLVDHARRHDPALFGELLQTWRAENAAYLGTDLDALANAVADPRTVYQYRLNYPVARLAAVQLFKHRARHRLRDLFTNGKGAMEELPVQAMANRAGDIRNPLPPMPEPDAGRPGLDAYRRLGAMVLLDCEHWKGTSGERVGDYYACHLHHARECTSFVALDSDLKPVGYATWCVSPGSGFVTLARQVAPFGDHLTLQKALEWHLRTQESVDAHHPRSARARQAAW